MDFKERIDAMANQFMRAEEVAKELGISKSFAYKLIRQLNQELREQGFLTISGRINRDYFQERLLKYGIVHDDFSFHGMASLLYTKKISFLYLRIQIL